MDLLKQIQEIRKLLKESQGYVLMFNETVVDTFTHFLIWDDDNYIVYAITANVELDTQAAEPYRIKFIDYNYLERMQSLFSDNPIYNNLVKEG